MNLLKIGRQIRFFVILAIFLLVSGCAINPETAREEGPTQPASLDIVTIIPENPIPVEMERPITPSPIPGVLLPGSDQVIFTIPNPEPWSGVEGDPRPDWKAWGAETFTVAPDGTFWMADTAVYPNRLLQYNPQGELLKELSLQEIVVYAYNLLVTGESIWVLDISAQTPRVVNLSLEGEILSVVDIPVELMTVDGNHLTNGAFRLFQGEEGELLLATLNGYHELVDARGEIVAQPVEAFTYNGHTFEDKTYSEATVGSPILVDGVPLEIPVEFTYEPPFLGFNPDGRFALAGYVEAGDFTADHQVRYYDAVGNVLGMARQYPQTFYKDWNHHLALGPDGSVYQLLSNPDHSVQVMRLGFTDDLPPTPEAPSSTVVPLLSALPPTTTASTDEEQARNTLLTFFSDLSAGNYTEAAQWFGGEKDAFMREPLPGETTEAYWEYICGYSWCLPIAQVAQTEQISEDEYLFYVVFVQPDGTRFEIGACCGGDPAATPPVWQFAYPVQKTDGEWKVMRAPLFTP